MTSESNDFPLKVNKSNQRIYFQETCKRLGQGDQIARIFAFGAIVFFGQFFFNFRRSQQFWLLLFLGKSYALILP
jgi:hypothetical protein